MSIQMDLELIQEFDRLLDRLANFIESKGVKLKGRKIKDIEAGLEELKVLNKEKDYISIELDKNGYIKRYNKMDIFMLDKDLPADLNAGYYRIQKDAIVVDKLKRKEIWGE